MLSICFVICIIVIVMLVVVPELGGNIRKYSEKDRRKHSGLPEMDRQCIRKQSGSCEMGAVSDIGAGKNNRFCTRRTEEQVNNIVSPQCPSPWDFRLLQ